MEQISRNPWLDIPLEDYEAHMAAASVEQASMLADTLGSLLEAYRPRSLAILGSAGGNGLDRVDREITERVVVVDINADYLETCRQRYCQCFDSFESVNCDLSNSQPFEVPVEFVYAALVVEYLNADAFLEYAPSLVEPLGRIAFVFQDQSPQGPVTSTSLASIRKLEETHSSVNVENVIRSLTAHGLTVVERRGIVSVPGKSFTLLVLRKQNE